MFSCDCCGGTGEWCLRGQGGEVGGDGCMQGRGRESSSVPPQWEITLELGAGVIKSQCIIAPQ